MFLDAEELKNASKRKRADAQVKWALERGFIPHKNATDADGRPLVLRAYIFGNVQPVERKAEPNFGALRG